MSTFEQIPSGKKVDGPRYAVSPAELKALIESVSKLDSKGVADALNKYKDTIPGKDATQNTFEMMALYQHGMNLLGNKGLEVDGKFGKWTHGALESIQKNILGFQGKDVDGLPGPKTTPELINALQKVPPAAPTQAPPAAPANPAAANDNQTETVDTSKYASQILVSVRKIPGLENVPNLSSLGFVLEKNNSMTTPDGVLWEDNNDDKNWNILLAPGYKVENGKIVKITQAPAATIDTTPSAPKVLEAVQNIPGLQNTPSLSSLGFRLDADGGIKRPEGLEWVNQKATNDWSLKLSAGYKVENGKIVKITQAPAVPTPVAPQVLNKSGRI